MEFHFCEMGGVSFTFAQKLYYLLPKENKAYPYFPSDNTKQVLITKNTGAFKFTGPDT